MEKGNRLTSPSPSAQKGGWDEMIAPPLSIEEERKRKSTGEHFYFRKEKKAKSGTIHDSSYAKVNFMHTTQRQWLPGVGHFLCDS